MVKKNAAEAKRLKWVVKNKEPDDEQEAQEHLYGMLTKSCRQVVCNMELPMQEEYAHASSDALHALVNIDMRITRPATNLWSALSRKFLASEPAKIAAATTTLVEKCSTFDSNATNWEQHFQSIELDIAEGRFFTPREVQASIPVVLLGKKLVDRLFPNGNAIGQSCTVAGRTARVIGVLAQEGTSIVGEGSDDLTLIPVTFAKQLLNFKALKASILIRAKEGVDLETLRGEVIAAYRPIRRLHPRDESDFAVNEVDMLTAFIDVLFGQVEYGVWFIGAFAILIGCFSVANIMFVSVKERTPLIGVQKALGAKRSFILAQFLTEAVALCIMGALLALFAVGLLVVMVNVLSEGMSLVFGPDRFLLGLGIAVISGVIAGLAPALQAARMDPVEAMRAA